jgi:hypothetical protein
MKMNMSLDRLREIVEAYGAAAHRWPAAEREAALALLANEPKAQAWLDEALALDLLLDAAPEPDAPSDSLISRIMAARPRAVPVGVPQRAKTQKTRGGFWRGLVQEVWPYGSPALPAGALAASILMGVSVGLSAPAALAEWSASTTTTTASATTAAWGDQLVELALADTNYPEEWQQ